MMKDVLTKNFKDMAWKRGKIWEWNDSFINWLITEANNGNTPTRIGKIVGMDYKRVIEIANLNNIEFKEHKNCSTQQRVYHNYDWLYQRYIIEGKSHSEMAIEGNCTVRVIKKWAVEKYNLNTNLRKDISIFTDLQQDLIIGSLLGDGHIDKRETQPIFIISHAENQKDYLFFKYNIFKNHCKSSPSYKEAQFTTFSTSNTTHWCQGQYRFGTRILNPLIPFRNKTNLEVISLINEFSFSIWILDDAYRSDSNWELCFARFTEEEKQHTIITLKDKFGLNAYIKDSDNRYLAFSANDSRIIDSIILRNIPNELDIMKYKITERHITKPCNYKYLDSGISVSAFCKINHLKHNTVMNLYDMGITNDADLISTYRGCLNENINLRLRGFQI